MTRKIPSTRTSQPEAITPQAAPSRPRTFDDLPDGALVRMAELVRSAKNPGAPLPISTATFWRRVRAGTLPKPVRSLGGRITAWRVGDVRAWLANQHKR